MIVNRPFTSVFPCLVNYKHQHIHKELALRSLQSHLD